MDNKLLIHIPAGVYSVYTDPSLNWNYTTENEEFAANRNIFTPRVKVVGGSSSINSMVSMRGHPMDYDNWDKNFGLSEWILTSC